MEFLEPLQILWDYLGMHQTPAKADCIVGFGNFNTNIARRAAELYHQGYAPKILFTGGLGRNTTRLFTEPEAVRFAKVAMACGVLEADIILEDKSTNTKENIDFMREIFEKQGIPHDHVLGVHQPFMERRIVAALGIYFHFRHCRRFPADGPVCKARLSASSGNPGEVLGGLSQAGCHGL